MTNAQIDWIRKNLIAGLPTIRKSRDRQMMREAVLRIRQLTGILEVRRNG